MEEDLDTIQEPTIENILTILKTGPIEEVDEQHITTYIPWMSSKHPAFLDPNTIYSLSRCKHDLQDKIKDILMRLKDVTLDEVENECVELLEAILNAHDVYKRIENKMFQEISETPDNPYWANVVSSKVAHKRFSRWIQRMWMVCYVMGKMHDTEEPLPTEKYMHSRRELNEHGEEKIIQTTMTLFKPVHCGNLEFDPFLIDSSVVYIDIQQQNQHEEEESNCVSSV